MTDFTPVDFVAGSIPVAKDSSEAAWHAAVGALDTERIKMVVSVHDGRTWFMAAAASAFASNPGATTALGSCLPGLPGFRGYGAYLAPIADRQTGVIVITHTDVHEFTGDWEEAEEFARSYSQPVFEASGEAEWLGFEQRLSLESRAIVRRTGIAGVGLAIAASAIWIGLAVAGEMSVKQMSHLQADWDAHMATILSTVNQKRNGATSKYLKELNSVSSTAAESKGVVLTYEVNKAGAIYWEMALPAWVSPDHYRTLGDVSTSQDKDGRLIVSMGKRATK